MERKCKYCGDDISKLAVHSTKCKSKECKTAYQLERQYNQRVSRGQNITIKDDIVVRKRYNGIYGCSLCALNGTYKELNCFYMPDIMNKCKDKEYYELVSGRVTEVKTSYIYETDYYYGEFNEKILY